MNASLEKLAAAAVAAVPGLAPASVGPWPDDPADFRSAVVVDTRARRWRVRAPVTDAGAMRLAAEHTVLSAFTPELRARLPFRMPSVAGSVDIDGRRGFVYSHLPGRPVPLDELPERSHAATARKAPPSALPVPEMAEQIAGVLAAVHGLPRGMVLEADLPAYSADQCRRRLLNQLDQAATTGRIPQTLLTRWEQALEDRTLWRFTTRVVHGDLQEDHLVVEENRVAAVTGWTDVHVGDPAVDLAWLIGARDPGFPEAVVAAYNRRMGLPTDQHLLRRAHLEAEFALARRLVRGLERDLPQLVDRAAHLLGVLERDVQAYDREPRTDPPRAEESVEARREHARTSRERDLADQARTALPVGDAPAPGPDAGPRAELSVVRDDPADDGPQDAADGPITRSRPARP